MTDRSEANNRDLRPYVVSTASASTVPAHLGLVGRSDAIRAVEHAISRAAQSDGHVLLTGEDGVGRHLVARLIHRRSQRAAATIVSLSCAGVPELLAKSELFGHVRGSFAGAYRDKPGLLELAHTGTVFLDEVGEIGRPIQDALLQFLKSGDVRRLGAEGAPRRVNVRVVSASPTGLETRITSGAFREDLHARLTAVHLAIPPLRDRAEDVPLLVACFLEAHAGSHGVPRCDVSSEAMAALVDYRWPENVRELKDMVERLALRAPGSLIALRDLPREVLRVDSTRPVLARAD
jgi:DNA-binding NtrC family response regulator